MSSRVASLEVAIGANVTGFQQAAGQVKSGLNAIAKEAKSAGAAVGDYSHAAQEMAALSRSSGSANEYLTKTTAASTAAFVQSLSAGQKWGGMLMDGAKAAELNTSQISRMAEASGLWRQSQIASATASELLTKKAYQLSGAVRSGSMTAEQAGIAYRNYSSEMDRMVSSSMTFGEKFGGFSNKLNSFAKEALKFGGAAVAVGYAGKQIYEFGKTGAAIEYTTQKFDRLARSVGSTGDVFLQELRGATRGTVSDFDLLKQGSDLLQLGLAGSTQEAVRLSSVMTALGMDTGELTLALANQSKRRLDQLGLSLSKFNEIEAKLKNSGMNKQDAFKEAFLQTAEQTVVLTGNRADSEQGDYLRAEAEAQNLKNQAAVFTNSMTAETVSKVGKTLQAINMAMSGQYKWENFRWDSDANQIAFDVVKNTKTGPDRSEYINAYADHLGSQGRPLGSQVGFEQRALQWYTNQQRVAVSQDRYDMMNATPEARPAAAVTETIDYAALLEGGVQLTDMTRKYSAATEDLNAKLADEQSKLDELVEKYGENSDKVSEQRDKVASLNDDLTALGSAMEQSSAQFALGMLQNKQATEEQQYAFAYAAGMITEDAKEMFDANNKLSESYMSGKISADEYAAATAQLSSWVESMSGAQINSYIDVWIRVHGSMPSVGNGRGNNSGQGAGWANNAGVDRERDVMEMNNRWAGGPLDDNGFTVVGDAPGGAWTPYTEVIYKGQVFNNKASKALRDAGLLDSAEYAANGTANSIIKKNVTISNANRNIVRPNTSRRPRRDEEPSNRNTSATTTDASQAAINVSQQAVSQQQQVSETIQQTASQTVAAQQDSTNALVEKLDEVAGILRNQPTRSDAYDNARAAQQMNI